MAGDYTRFTFKPPRDYSGVFKQQGRVDLDADFNELIEIIDRRWRSETLDIISHCIVPNTTPDAFLITPTAMGAFDIGVGRMYVDGIQVENHGLPPLEYQADLGEMRGTAPISYDDQPYLPAPLPPALAATANTTDLIYLDIWQREVTVLEDPSIREIALGGPDTTTRIQSVWQVRVLENVGPHGCGDDIAIWDQTIAPSAGRLTTSAVAPPTSDDPCIISPSGGYRGLENRLYRVEIHSTGPIGGGAPAKLKWSRNNATIASAISAIPSPTQVTIHQIGRDQVLRFVVGNWIEITDDFREFQGLAGHMAEITAIDEANRILTFAPAIPGAMNFNAADPSRHTRVRRWDQSQNVDANGLLDVTGGPIDIEDGIRVSFALDPAGGNFKIGDYWVFAARTVDGSVEILDNAPPRGILHHYCRLGFIHWGADIESTTFTDCRVHWPPGGECDCCTVTVGDGIDSHGQFTDIQQAINALGNRGGVVCIGRGVFPVRETIQLDATKRNVIIRGMGPATRIIFTPQPGAPQDWMQIRSTEHVSIEGLFVAAVSADALIRFDNSHFCTVQDCTLVNLNVQDPADTTSSGRAIEFVENCTSCVVQDNALLAAKGVVAASGAVRDLLVRDNHMLAVQLSIFVQQAQGLEVIHNQLRGLGRETLRQLTPGQPLSRDTIDGFQTQVAQAFRAAISVNDFQAVGVLVYTGQRVVISHNLITAQVGILAFLLIDAQLTDNQILALIGMVLIFGVLIRFANSLVLGILAGLLQAGIIGDLLCEGNTWLGLFGIVLESLGELMQSIGPLLALALDGAGFTGAGTTVVTNALTRGQALAGRLQAFGLAATLKIHRNVFLTFFRGIYKADTVLSADMSVVDNTFLFCSQVGIDLGVEHGRALEGITQVINPRHLIQGNALNVSGRGIASASSHSMIHDNSIICPAVAIELDGPFSAVRNNILSGTGSQAMPSAGLIVLHNGARSLCISGNRLTGGPGHGILIQESIADLSIDDNMLQLMLQNGISTASDVIFVSGLRISRNQVRGCLGGTPQASPWHSGVLVIGSGQDVRVTENTFVQNGPTVVRTGRFDTIYLEDILGAELTGNLVADNASLPGLDRFALSGIFLLSVQGDVRIHGNTVRENGGFALGISGSPIREQIQRVLVQDNYFASGINPYPILVWTVDVESLQFQGNQSVHSPPPEFGGLPSVYLNSVQCNTNGNTVQTSDQWGLWVISVESITSGNMVRTTGQSLALEVLANSRGIVTSNLTTGIVTSGAVVVRANNLPPP
jgi:Family of unknown function (DUF6519)/Periplasmic copper-binding protein (NosD)